MKKLFSLITALVLCTAMWGAKTLNQTLYKVEGALYQGLDTNFVGGTKIFVPNDSAAVFTSFDGQPADWYRNNELQEGGEGTSSFTFQKGFGDYAPIQIRNYTGYGKNATKTKINYIYGKAAYNGTTLVVGASGMNMMSMANGYYFRTEDSTTTKNIGVCYADNKTASCADSYLTNYGTNMMYGTKFSYSKSGGAVQAYEMILDNPGEMYIDYVVLPIFGYPKDKTATIDKMIPTDKTVTLELYPLSKISKDETGKYSYTKKSTPVSTMTVDAGAYTQDTSKNNSYSYRGTLKFELDEPILMTTSFVARLTWDEGCDFGLITDDYNLQNYTTWYIFPDGRTYLWGGGGSNSSISYHATFPSLDKKDTKTAFNFASTGGSDNIAFRSNVDPTAKDFTIDFGGAEWISMTGITYSGTSYKKSGTNTLTFAVEANTGEAREATITLKHHLKEISYTVSQEAAPVTKYYAKNNWDGATEWSWLEMSATDKENIYMLDSVVFGGTGVNINDKEDDTDALSFDTDKIVVLDGLDGLPGPVPPEPRKRDTIPYAPRHSGVVLEAPQLLAGDTIKLFFNAEDSTLKAFIIGRPAPVIEYKYTTYTEWQVKQDETSPWGDMTKQEDGTFTVASLWYNLGLYIASGENPIKQDWYPLDDAALTVAEDVAELDNVVITLTVKDDETVALNVKKQTATSIDNVKAAQGQRYNILGQPVKETYRGIVIMNGQTFIQ